MRGRRRRKCIAIGAEMTTTTPNLITAGSIVGIVGCGVMFAFLFRPQQFEALASCAAAAIRLIMEDRREDALRGLPDHAIQDVVSVS
ncbi:MAG: hypothetical protein KJ072_14975 [Verrucomicrobia bacterium]|nr:hypothetical protein [Verrucomicrobiota bacterium]